MKSTNSKLGAPGRPGKETSFAFSGHETFVFRYGWLKKAVDAVAGRADAFSSDEVMVDLGVGKKYGALHQTLGARSTNTGRKNGYPRYSTCEHTSRRNAFWDTRS